MNLKSTANLISNDDGVEIDRSSTLNDLQQHLQTEKSDTEKDLEQGAQDSAISSVSTYDAETLNSLKSITLDPAAIKRLTRKIDRRLVPLVSILYLLSFLDRVNS